jgi:hypothetical protein
MLTRGLSRSKETVLDFFRGAGVFGRYLTDIAQRVAVDRNAVSSFEMARTVLTRLNGAGDAMIGPRREILNRIIRTESFEHCWPNDRLAAKGVVAEIRKVIHERDAFTRMEAEKDRERTERLLQRQAEIDRRDRRSSSGRNFGPISVGCSARATRGSEARSSRAS